MEDTQELSQTFNASWQAMRASLVRPDFYIELSLIAAAVTLAWCGAFLLHRNVKQHLERHPPHKIDKVFILRPMVLLAPLFAFFLLGLIKPLAAQYAGGSAWVVAAMQISIAFLAARAMLLVIKSRAVAYFMAAVIMIITVLDVTGFMGSTKAALENVAFGFGKFRISMLGLAQGIIILVIVFWGAAILSRTLENYLQKSSKLSYNTRALVVKFFKIFVYFSAFLITLSAMGIDLTALAIFGGAMGVGVGLGLQKITANFVSGVTLLMEKSIKIGDMIEVAGVTGWVRQLNIRYALIEAFDGRELLIPNEILISTQVTNWTYSTAHARIEIHINVPFDSDGQRASEIMLETAKAHPRCLNTPEPISFLREFTDYGQHLVLNFWIADIKEGRQVTQSEVLFSIARQFKHEGIDICDRTIRDSTYVRPLAQLDAT